METRVKATAGGIAIALFCFTWVVFAAVATEHEIKSEPKGWEPPAIEQCDLPLWDRIRYKCPRK